MQSFLENLELILTGIGMVIIVAAFGIFRDIAPWKAAAVCATAVGLLHGIIFYAVRSAQRKVRHKAVRSIRYKLQDVVSEHVQALVLTTTEDEEQVAASAAYALEDIERSLAIIEAETLMAGRIR